MKTELVAAAAKVVSNQQILVNMVSRRVRQFTIGHRPMVEFAPGLGHADVALMEIAAGKLSFEFKVQNEVAESIEVAEFPGVIASKKAKRAA
jgi:DNA-directed RNA polymerase subunit omega